MNIVYVSDIDISKISGPGINEREFVQTLQNQSKERHDISSFVLFSPKDSSGLTLENVYSFSCPFKHRMLFFLKILWITCGIYRRIRILKREFKPDLFVLRISNRTIFVPLILSLMKQNYVIKTLEDVFSFSSEKSGNKIEKLYWKNVGYILGRGLKNAMYIDACTPQLVDLYKRKYRLDNINLVENSVNVDLFRILDRIHCRNICGIERFEKIAGFCGGRPSQRGAWQLIEVSRELFSRYPGCGILILGEDEDLDSLKKRVKAMNIEDRVVFAGRVDYDLVPEYMSCLDVGIGLDASDKLSYVGNASQKIRQYLACGIPIVCAEDTNASLQKNGLALAVNQNKSNEVYEAICHWFDMPDEKAKDFRITARNYAEKNLSNEVVYKQRYEGWFSAISEKREQKQ
jgi:glycosyltransferase involved in cell wall biosynthesis